MRDNRRAARRFLLAALLTLPIAPSALAVVIATGDGTANTSAPPDDPGWANVGAIGSLTGVYIGDGWVLTANHVGDGAIVLQGVSYQPVAGSRVRLQKPPGSPADLIVYRIQGQPPLPPLVLAEATPDVGDGAMLIGKGWNREAALTYWDIDWIEVSQPLAVFSGFKRLCCGDPMRWGRNAVTATGLDIQVAGSPTRAFEMLFDLAGGVSDEALPVPGDSGGAVFVDRGGQWELAGILFASSVFGSQPSGTAVFGQAGQAVDLAFYREEILAVVTPSAPVLSRPATLVLAGALALLPLYALRAHRLRSA